MRPSVNDSSAVFSKDRDFRARRVTTYRFDLIIGNPLGAKENTPLPDFSIHEIDSAWPRKKSQADESGANSHNPGWVAFTIRPNHQNDAKKNAEEIHSANPGDSCKDGSVIAFCGHLL